MAWNTVRKEDKPYNFNDTLVLVEYQTDGRLYFANNRENILSNEGDFLAVSYIPTTADDTRLPVVAVRCLGYTSKHFLDTCKWLNFDPNTNDTDIKPRYHEENVIKNISRDDNQDGTGGAFVISVNPATGEVESVSSEGGYKPKPSNSNDGSNNSSNGNNSNDDNDGNDSSNHEPVNSSNDSFFEELENMTKPEKEEVQVQKGGVDSIFTFIKKVH